MILPEHTQTGKMLWVGLKKFLLLMALYSWAAYQDIIGQCFSGASVSPTDNPNGSWSWGDEWYWITFNNTVPVIGEDAADEEYLVNQNGSRGSEYVFDAARRREKAERLTQVDNQNSRRAVSILSRLLSGRRRFLRNHSCRMSDTGPAGQHRTDCGL